MHLLRRAGPSDADASRHQSGGRPPSRWRTCLMQSKEKKRGGLRREAALQAFPRERVPRKGLCVRACGRGKAILSPRTACRPLSP